MAFKKAFDTVIAELVSMRTREVLYGETTPFLKNEPIIDINYVLDKIDPLGRMDICGVDIFEIREGGVVVGIKIDDIEYRL